MKKVLLAVLGVWVLALGGILVAASAQPDDFAVERSIATKADPATIYAILSDFRRFGEWSPWEKLDPNMKKSYSGDFGNVGSEISWSGNADAGSGKMTITNLTPNQQVDVELEFIEPMPGVSHITWTITQTEDTKVTWRMTGKNDTILAKVFCLFVDMDELIGKDFEEGLTSLAALAEKESVGS